jgi:serine/threonine protein phosphatase PrpC
MAVADGMGGHRGGEVASAIAIQGIVAHLGKSIGAKTDSASNPRSMAEVLHQIHADVSAAGTTPETAGMGTTLSVVVLKPGRMLLGHVGDSRVYRLRAGELTQLTQDHSWVADEVRRGNISRAEAESHPMRNVLTQAVGVADVLDPMVGEFEVVAGDKILLCSDGLHGLVSPQNMQRVMVAMPIEKHSVITGTKIVGFRRPCKNLYTVFNQIIRIRNPRFDHFAIDQFRFSVSKFITGAKSWQSSMLIHILKLQGFTKHFITQGT